MHTEMTENWLKFDHEIRGDHTLKIKVNDKELIPKMTDRIEIELPDKKLTVTTLWSGAAVGVKISFVPFRRLR